MPDADLQKQRELAELHRMAQERLGVSGAILALSAWQSVNSMSPSLSGAWFAKLFSVTKALRVLSKTLAARYYNLARALATGYTYPDITDEGHQVGETTISVLYDEMRETLEEVIEETTLGEAVPDDVDEAEEVPDDTEEVPEEPDTTEDTPSREERLDDEATESIEDLIRELFPEDFTEGEDIPVIVEEQEDWSWFDDDDDDADEEALEELIRQEALDKLREEADAELELANAKAEDKRRHMQERSDAKASLTAGYVDKYVVSNGRNVVDLAAYRDKRRKAWVRVTGPHPCSFCAMLASRGAVYKTARSAGVGNLFHDNCHCTAMAVWVDEYTPTKREAYFRKGWDNVTKGLAGAKARNAYRKWLAKQYKAHAVPDQDVHISEAAAAA